MKQLRLIFLAAVLPLLLASPLIWMGWGILRRPAILRSEQYPARVPLSGPYTPAERERALEQIAGMSDPEATTQPTTQQVETFMEGQRTIERAASQVWLRRQPQRIAEAESRKPLGWTLIVLGVTLAALWSWASWRLLANSLPRNSAIT